MNSAAAEVVAHVESLEDLQEAHQRLSERRRRLHERIDVMERTGSLKPEFAALLETYKRSERRLSWDRRVLYRKIGERRAGLDATESTGTDPERDLLRRVSESPIAYSPDPAEREENTETRIQVGER